MAWLAHARPAASAGARRGSGGGWPVALRSSASVCARWRWRSASWNARACNAPPPARARAVSVRPRRAASSTRRARGCAAPQHAGSARRTRPVGNARWALTSCPNRARVSASSPNAAESSPAGPPDLPRSRPSPAGAPPRSRTRAQAASPTANGCFRGCTAPLRQVWSTGACVAAVAPDPGDTGASRPHENTTARRVTAEKGRDSRIGATGLIRAGCPFLAPPF